MKISLALVSVLKLGGGLASILAFQATAADLGINPLVQYGAIGVLLVYFLVKDYRYQMKLFELADKISDTVRQHGEDREERYRLRSTIDDIGRRVAKMEAV